ncbi:hypothetical protein Ddc_03096 [Ditylenchus destructor]|nr:hypothetical protein Ddc_03096 [Ditylenchus destructor]
MSFVLAFATFNLERESGEWTAVINGSLGATHKRNFVFHIGHPSPLKSDPFALSTRLLGSGAHNIFCIFFILNKENGTLLHELLLYMGEIYLKRGQDGSTGHTTHFPSLPASVIGRVTTAVPAGAGNGHSRRR